MKDKKEKILNIRNRIQNYNKFLIEYGFNPENIKIINDNDLENTEKEDSDYFNLFNQYR